MIQLLLDGATWSRVFELSLHFPSPLTFHLLAFHLLAFHLLVKKLMGTGKLMGTSKSMGTGKNRWEMWAAGFEPTSSKFNTWWIIPQDHGVLGNFYVYCHYVLEIKLMLMNCLFKQQQNDYFWSSILTFTMCPPILLIHDLSKEWRRLNQLWTRYIDFNKTSCNKDKREYDKTKRQPVQLNLEL